jgi:hypothetical protein
MLSGRLRLQKFVASNVGFENGVPDRRSQTNANEKHLGFSIEILGKAKRLRSGDRIWAQQ